MRALATVCALVTVSLVGHAFVRPGLAVEHQPPRQWRFVEESRRPGTHFGTFQSYQPSFGFAGGALYKSYLTDETTETNNRSAPTTLHIARLADGGWSDIWTDSGLGFDPACLIGDGDTLYAAVANYMNGRYRLLEIHDQQVTIYEAADRWANASKQNCIIFERRYLLMDTYGRVLQFDLRTKSFGPPLLAFDQNYAPNVETQYPQFSLVGDRLFIGDNSEFSGRWRYADVIGRVIAQVEELTGPVVYRSMLPPDLVQANTIVNDTASLDDRIFVAFTANDYKSVAEYWADYRNHLRGNLAMFAICDIALQCRIQRTEQPADISGNFVQVGEALYFFGGGWPTISVWRWSDDQFELVQEIATTLQCPYAFNFGPTTNGVIEGQVTDARNCGANRDDEYVAFRLEPR